MIDGAINFTLALGESLAILQRHDGGDFISALVDFVGYLRTGMRPFPWSETEELIRMVIAGIWSREKGGREIRLADVS